MQEEVNNQPRSIWRRIGIPLAVLFILVVLPLGSLLYLKQGFDYRKQALDELAADYGTMPDFSEYQVLSGSLLDVPRGNLHLVGWIDSAHQRERGIYGSTLSKLYEQFGNSSKMQFITLQLASVDQQQTDQYIRQHQLLDSLKVAKMAFLQLDETSYYRSAKAFELPLSAEDAPGTEPLVALVDSALTIRGHYNLREDDQIRLLIKHMATILPAPPELDIIFEPKPEI